MITFLLSRDGECLRIDVAYQPFNPLTAPRSLTAIKSVDRRLIS
jgi:hypothetical protein